MDESDEKKRIIEKVSSELNLQPFTSMPKYRTDAFPPVTQWLRAFIDAKFVICDSFHGAVFSIIFNKPFLIIGNKERGMTRFNSLLNTFELCNQIVDNISDLHTIINNPIDWEKVNNVRNEMKTDSIQFLKSNLK